MPSEWCAASVGSLLLSVMGVSSEGGLLLCVKKMLDKELRCGRSLQRKASLLPSCVQTEVKRSQQHVFVMKLTCL